MPNGALEADRIEEVNRLLKAVARDLGGWTRWPGGWPTEADTALLDAVFSSRARYETVVRPIVERYRRWDLRIVGGSLRSLTGVDRDDLLDVIDNRQLCPGTKKLKVDGAIETAQRLIEADLATPSQIRRAADRDPWSVRSVMQRTSGVGRATSNYFLMLIGVDGAKADTMVIGFIERALDRAVGQGEAEELVALVSQRIDCRQIELDHAIWQFESNARWSSRLSQ